MVTPQPIDFKRHADIGNGQSVAVIPKSLELAYQRRDWWQSLFGRRLRVFIHQEPLDIDVGTGSHAARLWGSVCRRYVESARHSACSRARSARTMPAVNPGCDSIQERNSVTSSGPSIRR